jgi:hypothetical protein
MTTLGARSQLLMEGRRLAQLHQELPSLPWDPLRHLRNETDPETGAYEVWTNARYTVSVRRYKKGFFLNNGPYIILGITASDESARHDWRDFQACKSDICGPEWEGIELYPAESRLQDPSNRFYLWCCPKGLLKFGGTFRDIRTPEEAIAPQRPFPVLPCGEHP